MRDYRIVFWNLNRKQLYGALGPLLQSYSPDLLILAECTESKSEVLTKLRSVSADSYHLPGYARDKLKIFTKHSASFVNMRGTPSARQGIGGNKKEY